MDKRSLLKLVVDAELDFTQIEQAAREVPDTTDPNSPICGVELQRIDIAHGKSTVFISGTEESAHAFERCLKVAANGKMPCGSFERENIEVPFRLIFESAVGNSGG
jgi:hypothetical protein